MAGLEFSRPSQGKKTAATRLSDESGPHRPPSPPARRLAKPSRWRDPRLALGVALVATSVIAGSWVVASADDRVTVWAAAHDLAPGTAIRQDDLTAVAVRLDAAQQYIAAPATGLIGRRITRAVSGGELIPVSAVGVSSTPRRLVTVPVEPLHAPAALAHGELVDVYVSPREGVEGTAASRLVLANALVSDASIDAESSSGQVAVVLDVSAEQAAAVVGASRSGVVDLVRVPIGAR